MLSELRHHITQYGLLLAGLMLLVLAFFAVWPNHASQRLIALIFTLFYFLWGVITHVHTKTITRHVIYEYLSVSLLAGAMLFFITL